MGVYIKNMEMPKSCETCPCKTADAFGGLGCQATGYIPLRKANQDRPDNCPLVPVPEHGRLIDGDEMEERFTHCFVGDAVGNMPTIIPADPADREGEG